MKYLEFELRFKALNMTSNVLWFNRGVEWVRVTMRIPTVTLYKDRARWWLHGS